jgi:hypothetical protein
MAIKLKGRPMQITESAAHDHRPISNVRDAAVLWTKISFKSWSSAYSGRYYAMQGRCGKASEVDQICTNTINQ